MRAPTELRPIAAPGSSFELRREEPPNPSLNRRLYASVGATWQWTDRRTWTDADWARYLGDRSIETWVLWSGTEPAGYFELAAGEDKSTEIAYFGLAPAFIGRGLGGYLLSAAVTRAFDSGAVRVWLHTSSRDHPHALSNYQARGFTIFRTEQLP